MTNGSDLSIDHDDAIVVSIYPELTTPQAQRRGTAPAVAVIGRRTRARTEALPTDRLERTTGVRPDGTTVVVERNIELGTSRIVGDGE